MKKILIVMCIIGLVATGAFAYPAPNSFGIYTDYEAVGLMDVCADVAVFANQTLYLVVSGPTGTLCVAWEAQVEIVTTVDYFGTWEVLGGGQNYGSGDDYLVGISPSSILPNAISGNFLLMQIALTVVDVSAPIEIYVRRATDSESFPDGPGYMAVVGFPIQCVSSTGGPLVPVFVVNPDGGSTICPIVENTESSWGNVKSLYK
jgi:hypothetical protein